jgi:hypothetical protein
MITVHGVQRGIYKFCVNEERPAAASSVGDSRGKKRKEKMKFMDNVFYVNIHFIMTMCERDRKCYIQYQMCVDAYIQFLQTQNSILLPTLNIRDIPTHERDHDE